MSRRTRTDYNNIFDNGLDNMSDLVHAFTKKNKRVHRIFDDDDDDVQAVDEQSYGLRLVSVHEAEATTSKQTASDKENASEQAKKVETNFRPLSPVHIDEAQPEQILENRSPFKHPSQLSNRQNISLRRSLFQQQPQNKNNDLICSTPSTRNQAKSNDFFLTSGSRIENLSPIRKGLSSTIITEEDLNGISLITPESNKKDQNGKVIQSLHNLENDLRVQFQIDQETPKKTYSKSLAAETSRRRAVSETKNAQSPSRNSSYSEPISRSQPTRDCSIIVEPMEISKEAISMYRKTQLSRLSTSNLTNVNTINMIETPIVRQAKRSAVNDSLLAKKLALCESDSEISDDESEKHQSARKLKISTRQSQKQQDTVVTEENITNDESEKEVASNKRRKISQDIDSTPKKAPSRRPSRHSAPTRQDPVELQNNITNDESYEDDHQFEIVEVNNGNKRSQQKEPTPKKMPSRRPSKDVAAVSQKSRKHDHEAQNNSSKESDEEYQTKNDKNRKRKVAEPKKKAPEQKKSVHTTEASDEMVLSLSESENEVRKSTKNSEPMSLSKNNTKGRKSTKSTEQMSMSENESEYERSQPESEDSETQYSDISISQITTPLIPKVSKKTESKKSEADANKKKPGPIKTKKNEKNKKPVSEDSESDDEVRNQAKEKETEQALQFKMPAVNKKSLRDAISCNLSNVSAGSLVPTEIIESFRTLQKPGNETLSTAPESSKISRPKGTKIRSVNPNKTKIQEYLRLEKSVKHKNTKNQSGKSQKRTLFNQNLDDEQPESSVAANGHHDIDPIDQELKDELCDVRRSIETMSNASSQSFSLEIRSNKNKEPVDNTNEQEEEQVPKGRGRSKKNMEIVDNVNEQEQEQVPKGRGRPKKNMEIVDNVNEQEPKGRGRPKKNAININSKEPTKQQQTEVTDDSHEKMDDDSRPKASKIGTKSKMNKELKTLTKRPFGKRQNNTTDETEPQNKSRRKSRNVTSEESDDEASKNTDEGFQSNDEYDNVWYDPMERGCQRQGLRIRKFMTSRDGRFGIQFGVHTKNDSKAITLQKKYNIKESEVHEPSLAPFVNPSNKLELIKAIIMERKLKPNDPPKKKEPATKNKKIAEKINDGASTSRQAMDTESLASFATARSTETQSGAINRLLDNFNRVNNDNVNPINLVETTTYAISQINRLVWHPIGTGVFYSSFKENSYDGFLKLVKGGYKKGAKTRLAVVKMTLLCGVIDIKVNDTKIRLENLGFITITRGQSYRIVNASDETAIILMTRLDEEETTSPNANSSSS